MAHRSCEPAFPYPMQHDQTGKVLGGGYPGISIRAYFAAHAVTPPTFFEPRGLPPAPVKPPRLIELETQIASAVESDHKAAVSRAREAGHQTVGQLVVPKEESLLALVYTQEAQAELQQLQQEYRDACAAHECVRLRLVVQQWPWYWADLVLAGEKGGEG